jgi:hypothetical protein
VSPLPAIPAARTVPILLSVSPVLFRRNGSNGSATHKSSELDEKLEVKLEEKLDEKLEAAPPRPGPSLPPRNSVTTLSLVELELEEVVRSRPN